MERRKGLKILMATGSETKTDLRMVKDWEKGKETRKHWDSEKVI